MANVMLGFPNLIDGGNLSGGSFTSELPLSHLQFRQLGRVARSTDANEASTQFIIDFLQPRNARVVALINHTISFGGRWFVEASDDISFSSLLYSSSQDAWAALGATDWTIDELEWESDNLWLGTYSLDELDGLTPVAFHILPNDIQARYWRLRIIDTSNVAGYVDIGRMFIGEVWQPKTNYDYGGSTGYEDPSLIETSIGGAEYFDERNPYRVMRFTLAMLEESAEGFAKVLEIYRRAGTTGEILLIPDYEDLENAQRRNFLGRLRQLSPLEHASLNYASTAFEIKEIQ